MAPSRATSTVPAIRALSRSRPRPLRLRPFPSTSNSPPPSTPYATTTSHPAPATTHRLHLHRPSFLRPIHPPSPSALRPSATSPYSSSATAPPPSPPQSSPSPSAADDDKDGPVPPDYLSEGERAVFEKVKRELRPQRLEVQDISGGCGSMYAIEVVSSAFKGLSVVRQHRLVNEVLREEIAGWHGVQLKTRPS